jgi:hypothetical protein
VSRNRGLMRIALVVVVGLSTLVAVLFAWDRGRGGDPIRTAGDEPAIEARADLAPRKVLFGDTVTALVEVTLDRNRVDPDSVRVRTDFAPWKRLANPERLRRDDGMTTSIRMMFVLRCVTSSCVSSDVTAVQNDTTTQVFAQARVTYTAREGTGSGGSSLQAPWPQLVIGARYTPTAAQSATPWRADLLSLPAVTYAVRPSLLFALLLVAGTVLAIAGGAFAYFAVPRRAPQAPTTDGLPEPALTPLERALALLEDSVRVDGAADQRRALELVAGVLVDRGDVTLAQAARTLAWSKPVPGVGETNGLAVRARSALGEELHAQRA